MSVDRQTQLEQLRSLPAKLIMLVRDLSSEAMTTPYIPGEWTVAQNVHHVADAQMNFFVRFKNIILEDQPTLMPYDQDTWAESPDAVHHDVSGALAIIVHVSHRWQRLARDLTDEQWQRTAHHPETGELVAADLFSYAVDHIQVHIDQIEQTLAAREN